MLASLIISLALTLLLELGFSLLCRLRGRELVIVALANLATNPPVVLTALLTGSHWFIILPLELAAVAAEWLLYRRGLPAVRRPLCFSLCANALSYGLGLLFHSLF